jgi:hypothetical protein
LEGVADGFYKIRRAHTTCRRPFMDTCKKKQNTYNSGDSLMVTHLTTSPPVRCLNRAERTGSLVFNVLWSYVEEPRLTYIIAQGGETVEEIVDNLLYYISLVKREVVDITETYD